MRKFLLALGAITLLVIGAGAVGIGWLVHNGNALDTESKAFIDTAVPAIAANWSEEQFLDRATPELREGVKLEELKSLFEAFSRIGHLVEYEGSVGESNTSYVVGVGGTVSASYVAKARFQSGDAVFKIMLLKRNGHWFIQNFHVDTVPNGRAAQHV